MIKTGDTVRDGRGRVFQVGQLLGRGLWGRTYAAREDGSDSEWVVKLPYGAEDHAEGEVSLTQACREIFDEQLRILQSAPCPGLVEVETHFVLEDGTPVMVMPRLPSSLERRLNSGCSLEELHRTVLDIGLRLQALAEYLPCHGNLKANNILLDERGAVFLSDPMSPALKRSLPGLIRNQGGEQPYLPPEIRHGSSHAPMSAAVDSYSLSMLLYRGSMTVPSETGLEQPELPLDGLDKGRMVALKDRVLNRLKKEHSNPRFHTRLSDRSSALLNRGLSRETSPSPPYRFRRLDEYLSRIEELLALIHPAVSYVGKMIVPQQATSDGFLTGEDVTFSCTVACTAGVESQDEIACGLAVFDTNQDVRLRDVACAYTVDRHPSGRFRFSFRISDLPPGAFRVRTAFTLRESGDEPVTAEADFQVTPSPGYVPPIREPESRPLEMTLDREEGGGAENAPQMAVETPPLTEAREPAEVHSIPVTPLPPLEPDFPMPTPIAPPTTGRTHDPEPSQVAEPAETPSPTAGRAHPQGSTHDGPSLVRTVESSEPQETPQFSGTGRWSELPLPGKPSEELPVRKPKKSRRPAPVDTDLEPRESEGPVSDFITRMVQMIRGDQFVLFIGGVALAIIVLAVVLLQLQS